MRPLGTATIALTLSACPKETSLVEHYADRVQVPNTSCVLAELKSLAMDNAVQQIKDDIPLGTSHRFLFEVQDTLHSLIVLVRPDNSASIRHTAYAPNHIVSELQMAQSSIGKVEEALADRCGMALEPATESCQGRHCDEFLGTQAARL